MISRLLVIFFVYSAQANPEPCETVGQLTPDAKNCEDFYQCTHNGLIQMRCPPGLVFNPDILVCDWPKPGSKCVSVPPNYGPCDIIGQLKAETQNCNRFYQCTDFGWTLVTCKHGLLFNPEISICDWPQPGAVCGGNSNTNENSEGRDQDQDDQSMLEICETVGQLKPDEKNCERFYQCTHIGWAPIHCQDGLFFNKTTSVCDWPALGTKCGEHDQNDHDHSKWDACETVGELKSDAENCQNFYQCTNVGWKQINCPSGLFFNSDISVCDWPKSGTNCEKDNHSDDDHEICETVGEFKAESENCDRFYQCTRSGWSRLTCRHGLAFNPEISVCDWPKPGALCGGDSDTRDHTGNSDQDDQSMLQICETVGQLKPDTENCERFYQCTRIGWAPLHCEDGFYFNQTISACDLSEPGTKCRSDHDDDDNSKPDSCKTVGEMKSDAENCQNFYQCTNDGWKQLNCPSGLFFNSDISVCDWPKPGTKCEKDTHSDDDNDSKTCTTLGQLKAETENCDRFYQCTRFGWTQLTCRHGLAFNPEISVCDWPKPGALCGGNSDTKDHTRNSDQDDQSMLEICETVGQLKPDVENCQRFYQCTRIGWAPLSCQDGFFFNQNIAICDMPQPGTKCRAAHDDDDHSKKEPCEPVGELKSDPENSQNFYQCTDDGWEQIKCPNGTCFNLDILVCDWPEPGTRCGQDNHSEEPCEPVGELKSDPENSQYFYQCTDDGWEQIKCPNGTCFNPDILVCDWPKPGTKCGQDNHSDEICDKVGELKAVSENCDRFYQCSRSGWTKLKCSHGLAFNPEISVCDWPKPGALCGGDFNTTGNSDQDDQSMLQICEIVGQLKPDAEDCKSFYQCTRIGWAPLHCEDGFFFNQTISACDLSEPGTKCRSDHDDDDHSKLDTCKTVGELKSDAENCQNYYQCTNDGWKQLNCPSGLFFNSDISVCDWPKPGTQCEKDTHSDDDDSDHGSCTTVGELKAESENCDHFYQCSRSGWTQLTCGHGLAFNPETSACDWPKPGILCRGDSNAIDHSGTSDDDRDDQSMLEICETVGQLKSDTENCERFYQCTRIGWAPVHCQDGFFFNKDISVCDRSEPGTKCGKADHDDDDDSKLEPCETVGELKSDAENCQNFYQCTNNGWKQLKCPSGLYFNSDISVCDWPKPGTKCETDDNNHGLCTIVGELKAESENCDRFYQCSRSGWTQLTCGHGLAFNPETSVCDWPKPGILCRGDSTSNDHSGTSDDDRDDQSMLEICETVGQLKSDTENCERFYQCTRIGWAPVHCQDGFFFNKDISVCDRSEPGTKCGKSNHDDDDDSKLEPCETVGELKSDVENCQNFYQCTNTGWKKLNCPSGLYFNSDISVCDWPKPGSKCGTDTDSDEKENNLDPCEKIGELKADSKHCDLYYRCTSCGWSLVPCESGSVFNSGTLLCDKAEQVRCTNDADKDDQSGEDDHDDNALEPCEELNALKADPDDCEKYFQCTTYGWQNVKCYNYLIFNPIKLICDYSFNVQCETK